MPTKPPGRRTREEIRSDNDQRLLDAGREVFLAKGFHGASLDQVSAAAGLTKGAVYARFDSKAELFLALLERHIAQRLAEMRRSAGDLKSPIEAARATARQWMKRTSAERDWSLLTLEFRLYAARDPVLLKRYRSLHDSLRMGISQLISSSFDRLGQPPPYAPETMARLSLAMGNGLALERWVESSGDHARLLEELFEALVEGRLLPARGVE